MISFLLHEEPEEDLERWHIQRLKALWLEERLYKNLARVIHGSKAVS